MGFQSPQISGSRAQPLTNTNPPGPTILSSKAALQSQPPQTPNEENFKITLQPETRPISQEQLIAEVKGIYAGLVMVEAKCIEVDNKQATLAQADPNSQPKLNNEQWQALIALHRTLLHEHHDFFLASQHPSASPALRRLASKYAMPARMWRHGIHSFLELLRHRLPASLDHMLAFIYLAYSMMALLYETVPAFEDTWIECLGDLGRYRMAIEDDDIRDREVWTGVARHWYSKASDKAPTTGRLYHHLAILARPNALQQLFYYAKSLCVTVPFTSARVSILTLFQPVLNTDNNQGQYRLPPLDTAFVNAHGLLFTNRKMEKFNPTVQEFMGLLDSQIGRVTRKFMEQGYHIAVANSVSMLGFASKDNVLMKAMTLCKDDTQEICLSMNRNSFDKAQQLSDSTLEIVLKRLGDPNVPPFIHITLVFMLHISRHPGAMSYLEANFPWEQLSVLLHTLLPHQACDRIENSEFPLPEKDDVRPFPKDFAIRGLLWTDNYFPESCFTTQNMDEEEIFPKSDHTIIRHVTSYLARAASVISMVIDTLASSKYLLATATMAYLHPVRMVHALPHGGGFDKSERFKAGWERIWDVYVEEYSIPTLAFLAESCVLYPAFRIIISRDTKAKNKPKEDTQDALQDPHILLSWMLVGAGGIFYLAMDDWLLSYLLIPLWFFSLALNVEYFKRRLAPLLLPESAGMTFVRTTTLALMSVGGITRLPPPLQGRYSDPWTYGAFAFLPAMALHQAAEVARVTNCRRAKRLEKNEAAMEEGRIDHPFTSSLSASIGQSENGLAEFWRLSEGEMRRKSRRQPTRPKQSRIQQPMKEETTEIQSTPQGLKTAQKSA